MCKLARLPCTYPRIRSLLRSHRSYSRSSIVPYFSSSSHHIYPRFHHFASSSETFHQLPSNHHLDALHEKGSTSPSRLAILYAGRSVACRGGREVRNATHRFTRGARTERLDPGRGCRIHRRGQKYGLAVGAGDLHALYLPYGAHLSGLWPDSGPTGPAAAQSPQGTAGTGETAAQAGGRRTAGARGGAQATRLHDRRRPAPATLVSDG